MYNAGSPEGKGLLVVLSGPSGVGKGTVCAALRECSPQLVYSVSATTRAPRQGETDGSNYFFKTREQFERMIAEDELLEWAEYVGNYYGTPRRFVEQTLDAGKDVILEIEVQGAQKVKEKFPQGVFVFLLPPSLDELQRRIVGRGTENDESVRRRMNAALEEIEMLDQYDYAVVNERIETTCDTIRSIIVAERCKRERILPNIKKPIEEV